MQEAEITRDEHIDFLESTVRLKLWFLRRYLLEHPDVPFRKVLDERVDIWRKTSLNPAHLDGPWEPGTCPVWPGLVADMERIFRDTAGDSTSADFEARGLALLRPYLLARVDRDLDDIRNKVDLRHYQCGSLRYDNAVMPAHPQRIIFHIANDCYPRSPFGDPRHVPDCFLKLMDVSERRFGVTELGTSTWLNSVPRWLQLFPAEWAEHMTPPVADMCWHYGFWGQFITARKTFNHKAGAQFRQTGVMPYKLPRRLQNDTLLRKVQR